VTLDALDVGDIMCFAAGWQPPKTDFDRKQSRWLTWEEFDAEYEVVRDEFLAEEWTEPGKIAFAEARYRARHA
jgi:hypothetical protein